MILKYLYISVTSLLSKENPKMDLIYFTQTSLFTPQKEKPVTKVLNDLFMKQPASNETDSHYVLK